ncbi:hypothetical protein [Vibrio agarivorans]|uniref:Lipoprotein n=1 Tax=Vibrio agarivorans TaxID=153622 RepID=A0ABT7XXF3_9VIBR|nr:hypothetical protein [Vibrio agarivorans]MDN2480451.1 hypothetical protein [Vibrio agarivorans]
MKKLIPILATATLIGCGGSDNNDNPPTLPSAAIYTSGASQFHKVENTSAKFNANLSCSEYVRQIGEGEHNLPELDLLFEFNESLQGGQCRLEEVVATEKDLFLKGAFFGFTLHTEGSDAPVVVDCEILRVPMYDHSAGNDQLQCLATGTEDGNSISNYGLSLADNGDLYYVKKYEHIDMTELWRFNRNEQLTKVSELDFNLPSRPNLYETYTATGDYALVIANGGWNGSTAALLDVQNDDIEYFQWEENDQGSPPNASADEVGNLVFVNSMQEGYQYFNLDTGEVNTIEHFSFPTAVFGTPEAAYTVTYFEELNWRQTLMAVDFNTNTLKRVDGSTTYTNPTAVTQGESEVVFVKYQEDGDDVTRIGYIDSDGANVHKDDLMADYEYEFQNYQITPIAGGVRITDTDPENHPMTVYISTHNFEAFESEEEFKTVVQTFPVQKLSN